MKKKLLCLLTLCSLAHAGEVERDRHGRLVSTTSGGVQRDAAGAITGSKSTQANSDGSKTVVKRDANGQLTSSKTK